MGESDDGKSFAPEGLTRALRSKYQDLTAKYFALVQRTERTVTRQTALSRLSRWVLSITPAALALVRHGRVTLANDRFGELARGGPWTRAGTNGGDERALPLRAIVLQRAAALEKSGSRVSEQRLRSSRGERLLSLRLEKSGHPPLVMAFADDVTEQSRRDQELQSARQALIQQERLRMLGEAAAAVAHDLGSTLRSLAFRLATMETDASLQLKHDAHLKALSQGIESAAATVRRLHDFARSGSLELEPVKLDIILRQAAALFELEEQAGVKIDLQIGELPFVRGSAAELSHLFLNLLRNARDAMRESGGTVEVRSRRTRDQVRIQVCDQGAGVAPQNMARLFQPFFTTKGGQGTGLGLWLAAGTMRRMGGSISAHRRRRGMIFTLLFPLQPLSRGRAPPAKGPKRGGSAAPGPRRPRRVRRNV